MPTHGKATSVVLGAYDITPWTNSISTTDTTEVSESTVFQMNDKTYVPGFGDAKVTFGGRFEGVANTVRSIVRTQVVTQVDYICTVSFGMGTTHGNPALFGDVFNTSFGVTAPTTDVVGVTGETQVNNGWHDGLHLLDGNIISAGLTGPTVVVPVYQQKWAAAVHCIGSTVSGSVTVQLQSAPDGTTWSNLGSAVVFTASQSGSTVISGASAGGDYVRAVVTFSGTGSAKVLAAYGRF